MESLNNSEIIQFAFDYYKIKPTASYNEIQGELSVLLGRPPVKAERKLLTDVFRQNLHSYSKAKRVEEDSLYALTHEGRSRDGFLVITAYTDNYKIGPMCAAVNKKYCEQHGYAWQADVLTHPDLMSDITPRKSASWYKILMINRLLARELGVPLQQHHATATATSTSTGTPTETHESDTGVRYIMWIDADASIVDSNITLEQIIAEGQYRDILIGEDMHACSGSYINAGVFMLRVGEFSRRFFLDVWAKEAEASAIAFLENNRLSKAMKGANKASDEVLGRELEENNNKGVIMNNDIGQRRHYFFVRQFEQSAMQKVLKVYQQGLEFCYTSSQDHSKSKSKSKGKNKSNSDIDGDSDGDVCDLPVPCGLLAFHTFAPENAHIERESALLGRKHFPNVCVFPCWEFNSCLRENGTIEDDEDDSEEEEDGDGDGEKEEKTELTGREMDTQVAGAGSGAGAGVGVGAYTDNTRTCCFIAATVTAVRQPGARFVYHPAGKKNKMGLMTQMLKSKGLL